MSFVASSDIRRQFSSAMSHMYQKEVPLYSELMALVSDVNRDVLAKDESIQSQLTKTGELERLDIERHGAIRLGLPQELSTMRRLFSVMGMHPVGYYDLAPAGVPVHSTAFRAIDSNELHVSPFRVFTSLLRLELIADDELRAKAEHALNQRQIFTPRVLELIEKQELQGGLDADDAKAFVTEALETFRWHKTSPVSQELYQELDSQHRLIADVVGFKGPHINHLTPRTLDIDVAQVAMSERGMSAKAVVEGPPRRQCPILLRQTSFKALQESVTFTDNEAGTHTARFGEIEQRGVALTQKGRDMYDAMLATARQQTGTPNEENASEYMHSLAESFADFPDDYQTLHSDGLAFFYYLPNESVSAADLQAISADVNKDNVQTFVDKGLINIEPIVYEDFLPVSAAGIFQSNLGDTGQNQYSEQSNQDNFESALGAKVLDMNALYQQAQDNSLDACVAYFAKISA